MLKPLVIVIVIGTGIGLLLPTRPGEPPAAVASVESDGEPRETLLERGDGGHFFVTGKVNGELVHFVVDTGADTVALTVTDARRVGLEFDERNFQVVARGASGDVLGEEVLLDKVSVDGKVVTQVRALICQGLDVSLLGQTYLTQISAVQMNGDYMTLR